MSNSHIDLSFELHPCASELSGLDLGDKRRDERAETMFGAWTAAPESSLPQAMKDSAALQGAYRFFNNPAIDAEAVVAPHVESSWDRAVGAGSAGLCVLAIQDTTEMRFGGTKERSGLGELMNEGDGFYAHTGLLACLAETSEGQNVGVRLGLGGSEILVRPKGRQRKPEGMSKNEWARIRHFADDNEFLRWERLAADLDAAADAHGVSVVHVADREADEFSWITGIIARGGRFVVRQTKERVLADVDLDDEEAATKREDLLAATHPIHTTRMVDFENAAASGGRRRRKQARKGRSTTLGIHSLSTTLHRPGLS
jgi:hypothetical protein